MLRGAGTVADMVGRRPRRGPPADRLNRRSDMQPTSSPYAVRLAIDYPDRDLNRLTTAFRIFVAVPIVVVLATISGGSIGAGPNRGGVAMAGGLLVIGP